MKKSATKSSPRAERGLHELYREDPERADRLLFGRQTDASRRGFLKGAGIAGMGAALGLPVVFADKMPGGLIPAAYADSTTPFNLKAYGKSGLVVLNDRPINAETPPHLLDDSVTPAEHMFVRNNGIPPVEKDIDPKEWKLRIGGESAQATRYFTIDDLKSHFKHYTYHLQIECGGNGRAEYDPPAKGNQWTTGAVSCANWTGARLRDVLNAVGIASGAIYTAYYGADSHLSGDPSKNAISRGVPMKKAMEDESLIAWAVNGEDINYLNGYPLRVVTSGWPGSTSGKWLTRIDVRDRVHDGAKMTGSAYKVPKRPVAPGTKVDTADMRIIESMPVKSLITRPRTGIIHPVGRELEVRGHAWAGDLGVRMMQVSIDYGATWQKARLDGPSNRLAWQDWRTKVRFPQIGYYEVWSRASDDNLRGQPMPVPGWNPKGYLNNRCHRVAVNAV